jgi:hypothetical protein
MTIERLLDQEPSRRAVTARAVLGKQPTYRKVNAEEVDVSNRDS